MERIVDHLGLSFPNTPDLMTQLHRRVQQRDQAVLRNDGDTPYDGGADGGVVPDDVIRYALARAPPEARALASASLEKMGKASVSTEAEGLCPPMPQLQLRQTHEAGHGGWHNWTLSLEGLDRSSGSLEANVAGVRFELHPTFTPPVYTLREPPFAVGPFAGWGTFDVKVDVELRRGPPGISTYFPLDFESPEKVVRLVASA